LNYSSAYTLSFRRKGFWFPHPCPSPKKERGKTKIIIKIIKLNNFHYSLITLKLYSLEKYSLPPLHGWRGG
jgi:hypothetical protein